MLTPGEMFPSSLGGLAGGVREWPARTRLNAAGCAKFIITLDGGYSTLLSSPPRRDVSDAPTKSWPGHENLSKPKKGQVAGDSWMDRLKAWFIKRCEFDLP